MNVNKLVILICILNFLCMWFFAFDIIFLNKYITNNLNLILIGIKLLVMIVLNFFVLRYLITLYKEEKNQKIFITNSIHSLRAPLTIINGNIELMKMDFSNEYVGNIEIESKKLALIINNLMNYSSLQENIFLKSENFNISDLVSFECEKITVAFKNNNILFTYNVEENLMWYASKGRISILLNTLLENSFKYSEHSASCYLTNEYLEFRNFTDKPDGDYMHLFERFKRDNNDANGFGVGLSIVKLICDSNNMKITALVKDKQMIITIYKKAI